MEAKAILRRLFTIVMSVKKIRITMLLHFQLDLLARLIMVQECNQQDPVVPLSDAAVQKSVTDIDHDK